MKTICKIIPALFALFLLTTPLLLSSHGQVPLSRTRDRVSTSDRGQSDRTRAVDTRIENAQPTNDADKSIESAQPTNAADKSTAAGEPKVTIGSRSDDPKFKSLGCGLFCRKCIQAGGSCVPTPFGCFCE
jgi:hypothetical protein